MTKQDIYNFIKQNPVFCLAVIEDGKPTARAMRLTDVSEQGLQFRAPKEGSVANALKQNPDLEMCFISQDTQVRVKGSLQSRLEQDEVVFTLTKGLAKVTGASGETDYVALRPELKFLVLDNYDSFTYNLVHYLRDLVAGFGTVDVRRNNEISLEEVAQYDKILLSPGPGIPDEAGILKPLIATYGATKSILGVCLGCQAIAEVYGGSLINMRQVYHGVALNTIVTEKDEYIFEGLPTIFKSGRYHSWVVNDQDLPQCLTITSRDEETGLIMGVRHNQYDVRGVQFHPESVLTEGGMQMIKNWVEK